MSDKQRTIFSTHLQGPDKGRWIKLDDTMTFPPTGGKFVGYKTADGHLGFVNGNNTGGKLLGFLQANLVDHLTRRAGEELFLIFDRDAVFSIRTSDLTTPIKIGQGFGLTIVNGEQVLNVSAPGAHVIVEDPDHPGVHLGANGLPDARFVLVKLNPAVLA